MDYNEIINNLGVECARLTLRAVVAEEAAARHRKEAEALELKVKDLEQELHTQSKE